MTDTKEIAHNGSQFRTPWSIQENGEILDKKGGALGILQHDDCFEGVLEYVEKCVNSHDMLVETLKMLLPNAQWQLKQLKIYNANVPDDKEIFRELKEKEAAVIKAEAALKRAAAL